MAGPDWSEVKDIFGRLLELSPSERLSAATLLCDGRPPVLAEITRLLEAEDQADAFLEDPTLAPEHLGAVTVDPDAPTQIGRFPLERELGRGTTGRVFLARDPWLDRPVAIKVIRSSSHREQILQEARLLARCSHPNIATLYGIIQSERGDPALLLEFVEGTDLTTYLSKTRPSLQGRLDLLLQVGRALRAAHHRGIAHQDLKPQNILVTSEGQVKVVDFGIAVGQQETPGSEPAFGTPGYMSPEQIRGEPNGLPSDLFSFGCVAYEVISGEPAFPGRTGADRILQTLNQHGQDGAESNTRTYPSGLPSALQKLLESCLQSDPTNRPSGISVVLDQIILQQERRVGGAESPATDRVAFENTLSAVPIARDRFVGRREELETIEALWFERRFVTLTGPSGCGKTRLAVELVRRQTDPRPTLWLSVPSLIGPDRLVRDLLVQLRRPATGGLTEILTALAERPTDIVFDSCEPWRDACRNLVGEILDGSRTTRLLATSIQSLGSAAESVYVVPSLTLPPTTPQKRNQLLASDAAELFLSRVQEARPSFKLRQHDLEAVTRICHLLDGIPLALELAAARMRTLSTQEIARRLEDSFRLLIRGHTDGVPRQRTIRATFDWGYSWLSPAEQNLLQQLALFEGGWTLAAAEAIADLGQADADRTLELLSALVDKSFVVFEWTSGVEGRYRMLRAFRELALERLRGIGDYDRLRDRHLEYFAGLGQRLAAELHGPDQKHILETFDEQRENLLAAFRCAVETERRESALSLALTLAELGDLRSQYALSSECLTELFGVWSNDPQSVQLVPAHEWAGNSFVSLGQYEQAQKHYKAGLELAAEKRDDPARAALLRRQAILSLYRSQHDEARKSAELSLAIYQSLELPDGQARALGVLARISRTRKDLDAARSFDEQALVIFRQLQDRHGIAVKLNALGNYAVAEKDTTRARQYYEECLTLAREFSFAQGLGATLINLGNVLGSEGDADGAIRCFEESLELQLRSGERRDQAISQICLASQLLAAGRVEKAREHLERCLEILAGLGALDLTMHGLEVSAHLAATNGEDALAAELVGAAESIRAKIRAPRGADEAERLEIRISSARSRLGADAYGRHLQIGRETDNSSALENARLWVRSLPRALDLPYQEG